MTDIIKPAGNPVGIWVPNTGKPPSEWKRSDIPSSPGEYQLICTDDDGKPIVFPLRTDLNWSVEDRARMQTGAEALQGVIYIGMTTCLHCRFWRLVQSWSAQPPKKLHDSKETWNQRADLHKLYNPANMLCRYRRISSQDWHKKHAADVAAIINACWPDVGTNHQHLSAAAGITAETFSLLKWEKCFGKAAPDNLPPLNKEQAERGGDQVSPKWLEEHFASDQCYDED